jgi:DNA-binding transcriptional LysR family regulator
MNWRPALPELIIAAILAAACAAASAAVAGWPGVVVVAAATTVIAVLLLRAVLPGSAAQAPRQQMDKQREKPISGYGQRRFVVATSLGSRPMYESDLRPVLEHILAARLAENHAVNLYTEPDKAKKAFCRARGDAKLWSWIDPGQTLDADERAAKSGGIPGRTLSRLITRLEHL